MILTRTTFSLVNTYENSTNNIIYHFDLFRIKNLEEALDIGIEEYLDSGNKCFIEWPEIINELLESGLIIKTLFSQRELNEGK